MLRNVSAKCARCPTFLSGNCAGKPASATRAMATATPTPTGTGTPTMATLRRDKREGDISSTFTTFSGKVAPPLPARFKDLKRTLTAGREEELQASWDRLVEVLKVRTEEVARRRHEIIPVADFGDVRAGTVPGKTKQAIKATGVAVVRGVLPRGETEALLGDVREYFAHNPMGGFPSNEASKVVYESYWSRAQTRARSHPNLLAAQQWMLNFYKAGPEQRVDLNTPLSYCDRVQIRPPGDEKFALSPHVDGGGVERWEDATYRHTYRHILAGKWDAYDPWDMEGRLEADMNLYNAPGGCSVFRAFQGWLGLSPHGPGEGTLVVHPILKEATAYWLLRPFFEPTVKGSLDGWKFTLDDSDGNTFLHGSTPGTSQEVTPAMHPHLNLGETMVPYPEVQPGDTVFWSADTIHGTEPRNGGKNDACVFYIPSVPLTDGNIQYVAQQRDAFLKGVPPPDFPGGAGESAFADRGTTDDILSVTGKRAMGLEPFALSGNAKVDALRRDANRVLGYRAD